MSINSKRKGDAYERLVAESLSRWYGEEFRRTPLSGGWAGKQTSGDILPTNKHSDFPFCVECKNSNKWEFYSLFDTDFSNSRSTLAQYIIQAWSEAHNDGKIPMLVCHKKGCRSSVVFAPDKVISFPMFKSFGNSEHLIRIPSMSIAAGDDIIVFALSDILSARIDDAECKLYLRMQAQNKKERD